MKTYPNTVSRTLTPENKSLLTVIGRHDKRLTDAELNLIQDIQDYKRTKVLENTTFSGCLSAGPFMFDQTQTKYLKIPAFDVLFSGNVVTIGGNLSSNLALNSVYVPNPIQWDGGSLNDDASILVVYLEMWFKSLDPETGDGYAVIGTDKFFYPNGCVDGAIDNLIPDDTIDPFQGSATSARAQIQWALRTARLPLSYNFEKYLYGLDPAVTPDAGEVFARGPIPSDQEPTTFKFSNMGSINGDSGLWRAGDGGTTLGTMDGYSYAMPIAVFFQRNTGYYDLTTNPYGCAARESQEQSGTLASGVSGRIDGKFCDVVYPEDVIDTRLTVSLTGYDYDRILKQSFHDVISGETNIKLARGEEPGSKSTLLGSRLEYAVNIGRNAVTNTDKIGTFDGYRNGFSSDQRLYKVIESRTINQKVDGTQGSAWALNDSVVVQLNADVVSTATIDNIVVQAMVKQADGSFTPISLFGGQIAVTGIGTRSVIVKINSNLTGTNFDPGIYPLVLNITVKYPANSGSDLRKVMTKIQGGTIYDSLTGKTMNVFGTSDYEIGSNHNTLKIKGIKSYNPAYSNIICGTRALLEIDVTQAQVGSGNSTININKNKIDNKYTGFYIVSIKDPVTGSAYNIVSRKNSSTNMTATVVGDVTTATSGRLLVEILLADTCQIGFNSAVKGITSIEQTAYLGTVSASDPRIKIVSVKRFSDRNEIFVHTNKATIKGIMGDDKDRLIFVYSQPETAYIAYKITSIAFNSGMLKIVVPPSVNLETQLFYIPVSLYVNPDPNASMILLGSYIPYQGEGILNREYSILNAEETAFLTTNGTGAAPVVGIKDIYPYNRQIPISTLMPNLITWSDSDLTNQSLTGDIAANFEVKQASNIEHTIPVVVYTNDFIEPIASYKRKKFKLTAKSGARGFGKTNPNLGFGIKQPKVRSVLGDNLQATVAPVTLFVDNVNGNDSRDGLSKLNSKKTISEAVRALPPVLKHPVTIYLIDSGTNYMLKDLPASSYQVALYGDNDTRSQKYYSLANLAFTIQESGRLIISKESTNTNRIVIDGAQAQFGDGVTSAFTVSDSKILFNGLEFKNFIKPAVVAVDSDVEFLDCHLNNNQQGVAASQGSNVIVNKGIMTVGEYGSGVIVSSSNLLVSGNVKLISTSTRVESFFTADRSANITLEKHDVQALSSLEENISGSVVVLRAQLNSSVVCSNTWVSNGKVVLSTNSVLTRPITKDSFLGGASVDSSSNVITN